MVDIPPPKAIMTTMNYDLSNLVLSHLKSPQNILWSEPHWPLVVAEDTEAQGVWVLMVVIRAVRKCYSSLLGQVRTALPHPLMLGVTTPLGLGQWNMSRSDGCRSWGELEEPVHAPRVAFFLQTSSIPESGCSVHLGPHPRTEVQNQAPSQSTSGIILGRS